MNRSNPLLLLLLLFCLPGNVEAQQVSNSNKTLLWRISGKGLAKSSYLYGTMHLQDKRLFYFGDSLYHYLEQADGYAMEIDLKEFLDSMMQHIIEKKEEEELDRTYTGNKNKSKDIDSLLANVKLRNDKASKRELKRMRDEKLRKAYKNKEMPTIMDAYLYNIAKRSGKWLGGIEDIDDQLPLLDEIGGDVSKEELLAPDKEIANYLERMIKIYLQQDIDMLDQFMNDNSSDDFKNRLLLKRNVKMARRMDSLSHIRSVFFAVGAAHLPGDSGVISLLRKNGFTVEPVFSNKKLEPEAYASRLAELPWFTVDDIDKYYKVDMPAKPSDMDMLSGAMKVKLCLDFSSLTFYMAGNAFAQKKVDFDELAKNVPKNMNGELISHKLIEENSARGLECVVFSSGYYFKVKYLLKDSRIYMLMAGGEKKEALDKGDVIKFFKSFAINTVAPGSRKYEWKPFTIEKKGFSVDVPAPMKINKSLEKKAEGSNWNFKVYDYSDAQTGSFLMVQVRDVRSSYYITNDSVYFAETARNLKNFVDSVYVDSVTSFESYPAFRFEGDAEKGTILYKVLTVNRGNRVYTIFGGAHKEGPGMELVDRFMSSFHLTPYESQEFKKLTTDNMSVLAPGNLEKHPPDSTSTSHLKSEHFTSHNTNDDVSYEIYKEEMSYYSYSKTDTAFFEKMGKNYSSPDSILNKKWISNGGLKGMEWLVSVHNSNNLKLFRQFLNGDTLITLLTYIPKNFINDESYKQFFSSFRITNENLKSTIFIDKHPQLLKDLSSQDSVALETAYAALDDAEFSEAELPLLHEALMKNYDRDTLANRTTRFSLISAIGRTPGEATMDFIKANYKELHGEQEPLKLVFVDILAKRNTQESYSLIKKVLLDNPPVFATNYYSTYSLDDSLALTQQLFPEFLALTKNPVMANKVMTLANELLDSNMIALEMLKPYEKSILQHLDTAADNMKKLTDEDYFDYDYLDGLRMVAKFNNTEANKVLRKYLAVKNDDFKMHAVLLLLKNKQEVAPAYFEQIASNKSFRRDFYKSLVAANNAKLFPKKYFTQQLFAESDMELYSYDEDEPSTMKYIGTKTTNYQGANKRFYLFRIDYETYDEEENKKIDSYLGVAGPYSMDLTRIETNDHGLGIYYKSNFDAKKIDEQFKLFLIERKDEGNKEE